MEGSVDLKDRTAEMDYQKFLLAFTKEDFFSKTLISSTHGVNEVRRKPMISIFAEICDLSVVTIEHYVKNSPFEL